jgi:hypothetical protein
MRGEWIKKPSGSTAVVFVHGLLSTGDTCWRNDKSYWPELLQTEPRFETLGIYVFTYQTSISSGSYRLGDVVDALKEHMRLDDLFECEQIIFVCHSMGGIVVRKFLVERSADLIEKKTEIGLFLIASPSLGSSYANWLRPLAQVLGHAQVDALRFEQNNAWLNDLDKEFQNLKEGGKLKIRGKELIEDKFVVLKKLWRKQVVEPFSGARYFGEPFKVPQSDHFSIAKPDNREAIQHRLLCDFIKSMLDRSRGAQTETSHLPSKHIDTTIPEITLDWPYSDPAYADLDAFLAEATYREQHNQKPWFRIYFFPLHEARAALSQVDEQKELTSEDRKNRIVHLQRIEYLELHLSHLSKCLELILSEDLRRKVGWGGMTNRSMHVVINELLRESPTEGKIHVFLINHAAHLQAPLYLDRLQIETIFGCKLSEWSETSLSVFDCPVERGIGDTDLECGAYLVQSCVKL